jgi:hypothetical protein
MKHLYLFTLEIVPLEVGRIYNDLPSHLTLMSRFLSDLPPNELADLGRPLFESCNHVELTFGPAARLGSKKVIAHMASSAGEQKLHKDVQALLEDLKVVFQYPEFIGVNHKAHVTHRENVDIPPNSRLVSPAAYLIEVVDGRRMIRSKFMFGKDMEQATKTPSKKVQNWTKDFIKKYKPALKELSKK